MNVILHPSHTYYVNNYERIIQKYNFYNNNNNIIIIIIITIIIIENKKKKKKSTLRIIK